MSPAPVIRQRLARATGRLTGAVRASTRLSVPTSVLLIAALLAVASWVTRLSGGAPTAYVHAFYLPIIYAASRFHWRVALPTAVVAGLLAGPLMPLNTTGGAQQSATEWLVRLLAFVMIGCLVAALSKGSNRSFTAMVTDARQAHLLRLALAQGQLVPYYQPIIDLRTEHVVGFEALSRWQHPVRGIVPPADFIPLAERTGIDVAIGIHMVAAAARQTATWHAAGTRDLVIAVNISANHVCQQGFIGHITQALDRSGLRPENLCIEITETAIIHDRRTALANITHLHDLGVLISLDDFGTGQSTLAYLQEFPIDIVKIDQSFVSRVDIDPKCAALVLAIIQMAHALGATTVGEGIERASQLQALVALGCHQGQGYFLGRPAAPLAPDAPELRPLVEPLAAATSHPDRSLT
ncbi:putative bifunctional diguanylate cyclase/phosphodiesterase [Pengzhenrongella sicca]|uniref:EAL domain-containing protein n=1 Tax=Pengzhenrongella sicca TaxID=2819238 RepID=A0A8A4ZFU6_9MICO|nr:EAL domain-containing protein [Pengzhenrongella sicca]QTE30155.1 EAL domain-containing protein [Pengzhenrongella sicca]